MSVTAETRGARRAKLSLHKSQNIVNIEERETSINIIVSWEPLHANFVAKQMLNGYQSHTLESVILLA